MSVKTVSGHLAEMTTEIKKALNCLLNTHSSIHHQPTQIWGGEIQQTSWGHKRVPGGMAVGYSAWNPMSSEGTRAQSLALSLYTEFSGLLRVLLVGQPKKLLAELDGNDRVIVAAIQQIGSPSGSTPSDVLKEVTRAVDRQLELITGLYDGSSTETFVVPDTNALLFNPQLEEWAFAEMERFTVVLLPTVLEELDGLKVNHRNENVRDKAEGLITRIKGYRGRGRLNEGVPLRKGVSTLRGWAMGPDMDTTLPWLDRENADDRLLASFLEVMRRFPHSVVLLVTRDINLQNKAELARVPFLEPPQLRASQ